MNESLQKLILCFFLVLGLTIFFYWPMQQQIELNDSVSDISTEIKSLSLPIGNELREVLDRAINLPADMYQICLENNNRIYLVHTDNSLFRTPDVSQSKDMREAHVGAMAFERDYLNGLEKEEIYREVGQPKLCRPLIKDKLEQYASSTVLYHHIRLGTKTELDLGDVGKILITRVIGNSYIDTSASSIVIVPRWYLFWLVVVTLTVLLYIPFGIGFRYIKNQLSKKSQVV